MKDYIRKEIDRMRRDRAEREEAEQTQAMDFIRAEVYEALIKGEHFRRYFREAVISWIGQWLKTPEGQKAINEVLDELLPE